MKKKLIIFFVLFFQFNFAIANTKIAFIDMNKVISNSKPGSSIMKQLSDINSVNLSKFESEAKKLKEQEAKIVAQKNILSEAKRKESVAKRQGIKKKNKKIIQVEHAPYKLSWRTKEGMFLCLKNLGITVCEKT